MKKHWIVNIILIILPGPIEPIIIYEKADGFIFPVSLTAKPQEWFYYSCEGEFFFNSRTNSNGILIPEDSVKFLVPRHRADFLNPYGECLLSRCFWNVIFINGGMEFWLKFMEKYGTPWAIGKYDRSMSESEQNQLFMTLKRMVQDAVAAIPNDGSVEILNSGDKSNSDIYQSFITKCENNISKVILGQTLTTDIGSSGSYAAANIHSEVRADLIQNDIRLVENTLNEFIKKVSSLNFNETETPMFEIYEEEGIDQSLVERDNKVQTLGVKFTKEYIKKAYGYDDNDFDVLPVGEKYNDSDFSDATDDDYDKIDNLIDNLNLDETVIKDSLNPIIKMFQKSRDSEECMEMLAETYPEMRTEELEKMLTKVIFLSTMLGRVK